MGEEIARLRDWAKARTRRASSGTLAAAAPLATRLGG